MWRSFDRQHCGPICALRGAVPSAVLAAVIIICLSGFLSDAQSEEEQLSKTGEIDHQIIIREHAGWNMDCAAMARTRRPRCSAYLSSGSRICRQRRLAIRCAISLDS